MDKVTIMDIAREAGVSISTVSNALNGVDVLKPETRERIMDVADRLHYIPNLNGKKLKSKATNIIGLFTTSLKGPYFAALADIMFWECHKNGYELNIFVTWNAKSAMNNILGEQIDGSVILNTDIGERDVGRILELGVPAVFLDREICSKRVSSVLFDSYRDGEIAAEYIISRGFRRICYVHGILTNYDGIWRARGFLERLEREGITLDTEYILYGNFERDQAHDEMMGFLGKNLPLPEIIFAANDFSALGCISALEESGYSVPGDVMVMGVDDIELCRYFTPSLTTIRTGYERQGSVAASKLIKMIQGEEGEIIRFHGELIERESTCRE